MMENLTQIRNRILIVTALFGVCGSIGLLFLNINFALSFLAGNIIGMGYLWHLSRSVARISEQNKSVNTILRLALSISFMVLMGQILSLNLIFIVIGFLCNHVSMVLNMGYILLRNRA